MTTGYILILAVLVLGGAIATAGDRIGTKVGKARLSLFKLRPRSTATLITMLSGSLVAASTLGILLAADKQLRTGLFELDEIQQDLKKARRTLKETRDRKSQVEQELAQAQAEQAKAKQQLEKIEASLKDVSLKLDEAIEKQSLTDEQLVETQENLTQTQEELTQVDKERNLATQERAQVAEQLNQTKAALQSEIQTLQTERQQLLEQREATIGQITERDREIQENQQFIATQQEQIETQRQQVALQQERIQSQQEQVEGQQLEIQGQQLEIQGQQQNIEDQQQNIQAQQQRIKRQQQQLDDQKDLLLAQEQTLTDREALLKQLEQRQADLSGQVDRLEQGFRLLRERRVAIGRGQVLSSGVVRVVQPFGARQAIDSLLQEANRVAIGLIRPGTAPDEQVIQIPISDVEEWVGQIKDGNEYVMRVLASENYILGEEAVGVYLEADRNRLIFEAGEIVSATSISPMTMSEDEVLDRMEFLIEAARLRALQQGILAERIQVTDSRESAIEFIKQLQEQQQPLEVQAISTDLTYTAGPLKLKLIAVRNGERVLESD